MKPSKSDDARRVKIKEEQKYDEREERFFMNEPP
jgi:hypothetical protein